MYAIRSYYGSLDFLIKIFLKLTILVISKSKHKKIIIRNFRITSYNVCYTKLLRITLTAIIMLIAVIIFIDYQTDEVRIAYVNSVAKDNEFLLDTVTEKMSDFSTEDKAVDYLKSLPSTGTRYYFMLSPEKMVFERNTDSTLKIKDMSFDELVNYYTNNGGDGVNKFFSLIKNGNPFSATLIKDKTYGSELISINFVKINNSYNFV